MTTHYRSPDLLITHDAIAIRVPMWRRLMTQDLRDPRVVVIRASAFLGPRTYQLWVRYRGYTICLLSTTDATRFGQARRALARAFEREQERQERVALSGPRH